LLELVDSKHLSEFRGSFVPPEGRRGTAQGETGSCPIIMSQTSLAKQISENVPSEDGFLEAEFRTHGRRNITELAPNECR